MIPQDPGQDNSLSRGSLLSAVWAGGNLPRSGVRMVFRRAGLRADACEQADESGIEAGIGTRCVDRVLGGGKGGTPPALVLRLQGRAIAVATALQDEPTQLTNRFALIGGIADGGKAGKTQNMDQYPRNHHDLLDAVRDAIVVTGRNGEILHANARAEQMFGYTRDEMSGQPVEMLLPGRFRSGHVERRKQYLQDPQVRPMGNGTAEFYARGKDGREFPVQIDLSPLQSAEGLLVVSSIRDVTDRKQAQQGIQASEATLATVFRNAPIAMVLVDSNGHLRDMNGAAEEAFACPAEDVKGRRFGNAVHCIYSFQDAKGCGFGPTCKTCTVRRVVTQTFKTGQTHRQVEVKFTFGKGPDQCEKYLLVSAARYELSQGRRVLVCIEDITERKRAELDLQKALSEIEQLRDRLQRENIYLQEEIKLRYEHEEIVGQSSAFKAVLSQMEQVAATDSTVLILGETGSGKEVLARAIHRLSPRKDRAMVTVNCAALPSTLVESELFGREEGAYTGALSRQAGRFEVADGSTIFLDEVGELAPELQVKLLRVLEEGRFERLGSSQTIHVDVRIIAATNRDLADAVREGSFREDLYHRLNVFPISVPPLRKRREDIPLLVWAFVQEFAAKMGKIIDSIPRKSMESLENYPWPGNVRELRNVIERAMILSPGPTLRVEVPGALGPKSLRSMTLKEMEKGHILDVLEQTGWRVRGKHGAAEILGLKPTTLESRMRKLGIRRANKPSDIS